MKRRDVRPAEAVSVGAVARQTGLTVHTLRYYERLGLLAPLRVGARRDRRYRIDDLEWIRFVQRLRATGMPVRDMVRFAALRRKGGQTASARRELLDQHRRRLLGHIADLRTGLKAIDAKRALLALGDDTGTS